MSHVVRHEQHAELVLYASATFGSPTTKTFYQAVAKGWLTNYPTLTAEMIRKNQPQSPATALGHITIARFGIRSSQPKTSDSKASATTRSKSTVQHSPPSQPTRKRQREIGPPASPQGLPAFGLPADGLPAHSLPAPVELDTLSQGNQPIPPNA